MLPTPISPRLTITQVGNAEQFLVQLDSRVLYVSPLMALVIAELKNGTPLDELTSKINVRGLLSSPVTPELLMHIIRTRVEPLELTDAPSSHPKPPSTSIRWRFVLFRFPDIAPLLDLTRHLFRPAIFWSLFSLAVALSLAYLAPRFGTLTQTPPDVSSWLLYLGAMFLLLILHELGHASASWFYKVEPREIGVGVYLCFPVCYTDVTDTWRLPTRPRVVVNLGGVYFQLLANLVIIGAATFASDQRWQNGWAQLALLNLGSVLANLNPFFKFDGYWVYSDTFHLPNLGTRSLEWLKSAFLLRPVRAGPALLLYSVARLAFIGYVCWMIITGVPQFIASSLAFAAQSYHATQHNYSFYREAFYRTVGIALLTYSLWRLLSAVKVCIAASRRTTEPLA